MFSRRKLTLIAALLVLCLLPVFSQDQEKANVLSAKSADAFALAYSNPDSAMLIAVDVLHEAKKLNNNVAIASAYNTIGWTFKQKGDLDSALSYLEKALQQYRGMQFVPEIIRVSVNLGEVYTQKAQYARALRHLLEGDSLSLSINDIFLQTDIKRQLAILYREAGDVRRSSQYFTETLEGFQQLGDYFRYVNTAISLGILYRKMALPDSSLTILERGLQLAKKHDGPPYQVAMIQENIGETYFSSGQYTKALPYFQRAYQAFQLLGNQADLAYEALSIGKTLRELHRYEEAETYLLESYRINETLKITNYILDTSRELASLYERQSDWQNAHFYLQKTMELKDSLNLAEQLGKVNELKERYESEKQEQEIELLKTHHALSQSQAKRAVLWQYLFLLLFVAAAAIAWMLANKIRIKKKLEQIKQQERLVHELEDERTLNQFAISLYGKNTVDDILWDITQNCIFLLHFEDCVVYRIDEERMVLVQVAAAGPKKIEEEKLIFNRIEIPFGKGIVGSVAETGKPEIVKDASKDERYILDDAARDSEITVPIMVDGKVFGIIDSEHPEREFYTERHLELLQKIAAVCSQRLVKLLAEEKLRDAIARDLHDEIGSTLTSIHIMSNVAMSRAPDELNAQYLSKINAYASSMMENMGDIVWAINPQHDTLERLLLRMKEFSVDLLESAGITCSFKVEHLNDAYRLQSEERRFLYLIFKEALNNIVKYSRATVASVVVDKQVDILCMVITDNGIGFDPGAAYQGNGLKNMHVRAKAIGASLSIQSNPEKGTRVVLEKRITS